MKNLCSCIECEAILEDKNPQTGAKEYPDFIPSVEMIFTKDEDGMFWACPNCKSDNYLSDNVPTFFVSVQVFGQSDFTDAIDHEFVGERTLGNIIDQITKRFPDSDFSDYKNADRVAIYIWDTKEEMEEAFEMGHDMEWDFEGTWDELTNQNHNTMQEKTFKKCTCVFSFDDYAEAPTHAVVEITKDLYLEIKKQQEAMKNLNCYSMENFQYITKWGECDTSGEADIDLFTENEEYRADTSLLVVEKKGRVLVKAYEKYSGLAWETEPFFIAELDEFFNTFGEGRNAYKIRQTFPIVQEITVMADDERDALDIAETVECHTLLRDEDFPECEIIAATDELKELMEGLNPA